MPYSQFKTIAQAKAAFKLTIHEGSRFLPQTPPVAPSPTLKDYLQETLPIWLGWLKLIRKGIGNR